MENIDCASRFVAEGCTLLTIARHGLSSRSWLLELHLLTSSDEGQSNSVGMLQVARKICSQMACDHRASCRIARSVQYDKRPGTSCASTSCSSTLPCALCCYVLCQDKRQDDALEATSFAKSSID